jgi:hypothetical protein
MRESAANHLNDVPDARNLAGAQSLNDIENETRGPRIHIAPHSYRRKMDFRPFTIDAMLLSETGNH